jgi:hypothetical protein
MLINRIRRKRHFIDWQEKVVGLKYTKNYPADQKRICTSIFVYKLIIICDIS